MAYVRYLDKTREYYLSEGYEKPYVWAHHEDAPFTPLTKPLAECRVGLVSTSYFVPKDAGGELPDAVEGLDPVYSIPSDTLAEDLVSRHQAYDRYATHLDDVDSYFPITRLREFAAEGRIGSVAPRYHGVFTSYSQRKTSDVDSPEILRRCREEEVDVVVLTPL